MPGGACGAQQPARPGSGPRRRGRGWGQRLVVLEDALLQLAKLRARLDAELLGQPAPAGLHGGQSVRLPTGTVERHHQVSHDALAGGMVARQLLQFRDQFWSQADGQVRFDPPLERRQPPLLELVS